MTTFKKKRGERQALLTEEEHKAKQELRRMGLEKEGMKEAISRD